MENVRMTKSAKTLFKLFEKAHGAISAGTLAQQLNGKMNRTTVYRILDRLEEEGILHHFRGKDGLKYYAKCKVQACSHQVHSHPHFQCNSCGKTECLFVDVSIPKLPDYKIDTAQLLLVGQCRDCRS